jgi:MYXO-CTERM domain-containing protein
MRLRRLVIAVATLLGASDAWANGAFPNAGQFVVRPLEAQHLAVRTSFGILMSRDGGRSWGLACESGIGYVDEEPGIAITSNGTLLAAWSAGLGRASLRDGCEWALAPEVPAPAIDVSVQKNDPTVAVALTRDRGSGSAQLWESTNDGASWSALGTALPADFEPTTMDVAPSDAQRIYVAGTQGGAQVLARSDNRGEDWDLFEILSDVPESDPYLAAVDPGMADVVYVRTAGDPGRLLVSTDGGEGWVTGFSATGPMRGFALAPDGQAILVGDILGVWRAPAATLGFEQRSDIFVQCLAWAEAGVYACSNQYVHGFFLGLSGDEGASFAPILSMHCITLLDCAATTTVGALCPDDWPMLSMQLATELCPSGQGGASSAQSGAGGLGGGSASGAGGSSPRGAPPGAGSDCDCGVAGTRSHPPSLAPLLVVGAALLVRRRRVLNRASSGSTSAPAPRRPGPRPLRWCSFPR